MIMTQSGKMVDDTKDPSGMTQQPQSPNACLFVVACLLTTAFGKPGNTCNSETQFLIKHEDGSTTCEDCESCPPGQTLSIKCGKQISPSTMVICEPCKLGMSFSSKHGTSVCTPCSSCGKDQVVLQNCTLTQDIKCDERCHGNDRYYDNDKGDCFPCTKCCNDELDVVENECKEKLGTSSNMICSFHSSINRCVYKSTAFPQEPTTTTDQSAITDDYTTPSQGSKYEHTVSTAAQPSYRFSQTKATKHRDLLTPISVSMAVLLAGLIAGFLYIRKARQTANYLWCYNCDTETGIPDSGSHHEPTKGNLDMVEEGLEMSDKVNHHILSTESMEPLLAEGNEKELACSCQQDSKPLNSLLERESDLRKICNCLDTPMPGVGHYPAVAQYYGYDYYQRVSVFEKQRGGPSRALIESLQAINPELTVAEFASVVRKEANRNDVGKLLDEYDLK